MKLLKIWKIALATATTLAFMSSPVEAGPFVPLIGTAFTSIVAGASGAQVAYGLLVGALQIGVNTLIAKLFAPNQKQKGLKEKIETGGDNPLSFLMGEMATPGKLAYINQTGAGGNDYNNLLVVVMSLSEVPVSGFSNIIWINNERCVIDTDHESPPIGGGSDPNFDEFAPRGGFMAVIDYDKRDDDDYEHQYCWVKFYDGTQTAADPYLLDTFGDDEERPYTADMVGRGCAYAIMVCRYSKEGIWSGIPTFKFEVKGIKAYDPRKDSSVPGGSGPQRWRDKSTWGFSKNPMVLSFNALRGIYFDREWIWGGQSTKVPYESSPPDLDDPDIYQYPMSYWFPAMNHCDENIHTASDEDINRYTAAAEITVDQAPIDVIKELMKTCGGFISDWGGTWRAWAGPWGLSVFSFSDENLIITEEQNDDLFANIQDVYNAIHSSFLRPGAGWVMKDAPYHKFASYRSNDGIDLVADVQFNAVNVLNQVNRLARLFVKDSRRQIRHVFQLPPEAYPLEPYDVVTFNSTERGYISKKFVVLNCEDLPNFNKLVALREVNTEDYDYEVEFDFEDSVGDLTPSRPGRLALDFNVFADQIDNKNNNGKDKPAIRVEWNWGTKDIGLRFVKWELRRTGQTKVIGHGTYHNVEDSTRLISHRGLRFGETYEIRLNAIPEQYYRKSNWTGWKSVTMANIDIPGAPTLTRVSKLADDGTLDFFVDVDWTALTSEVTYVVRIVNGGKTVYRKADENTHREPVTSGDTVVVAVRAIAADGGTKGDFSSTASLTITKKNTAPLAPTSLSVLGGFQQLVIDWSDPTEVDNHHTNIYEATTNDFTTANLIKKVDANGWTRTGLGNLVTRYYWVAFVDRSGNVSSKFPVSNTGGISATTQAITDGDTGGPDPNPPTGLAVTARTNLNGDGKIDVEFVITFTGIANRKASYNIRVQNVGDGTFDKYVVKDDGPGTATTHRKIINVISGVNYNISVASVSGTGNVGSYTSNVNITAVKKTLLPTAPTSLVAVGKIGRINLRSNKSPDADYRRTNLYASNTNDFTTATQIDWFNSTKMDEGDLGNAVTRYYWITFVDRSGNESTKYPVSNTAGISATTVRVTDDDTDPTLPNTPSAPSVSLSSLEVADDGTVIANAEVTWSAVVTGVPVKSYMVKVTQVANSKVKVYPSDVLTVSVEVKTGKSYNYQVAAVNAFGKVGAYSTATAFTVSKKSATPNLPTGFSITPKAKGLRGKWTQPADTDIKFYQMYVNTANNQTGGNQVRAGNGDDFFYAEELVTGQTYYSFLRSVDRSDNVSAWVAASNNPQTYRGATTTDIEDGAVTDGKTDSTAPNTPSAPSISTSSLEVIDDGTVIAHAEVTWSAVVAGVPVKSYMVKQTQVANGKVKVFPSDVTTLAVEVKTGKSYNYQIAAVNAFGKIGSYSTATAYTVPKKSSTPSVPTSVVVTPKAKGLLVEWTHPADTDVRRYDAYVNTTNSSSSGGNTYRAGNGDHWLFSRELVVGTAYYIFIRTVDQSGNISAYVAASNNPQTYRQAQTNDLEDDAVTDAKADSTAPNTPSAPSISTSSLEVIDDGTVIAHAEITWSAVVTGVPVKSYMVKQTQVSNSKVKLFPSDVLTLAVEVKTGKSYNYQIAAVNAFGKIGSYSTATAYTVPKKSALPNAPSGFTITPKGKGFYGEWTHPADTDIKRYNWYVNTTNSSSSGGNTYRAGNGDSFHFGRELVVGTSYYVFIQAVDQSGNVSAYVAASNNPQVFRQSVTNDIQDDAITEDKTDPTAPGTPTGVTPSTGVIEVLEDGTAQAHTDLVWTAPVGGVPVKSYLVKVTQVSNSKVREFPADGTSISIEVKTGKSYNYQVAAVNAFGKVGTYSSAVAYTRTKKGSTIPAPAGLSIVPGAKNNKLDWNDVDDDTYPDFRATALYRNTVNTTPTPGTTPAYKKAIVAGYYVDQNITPGTTYYYWIAHRDKSGNFTSISSVVSSAATFVVAGDIGPGAITSDKLGIGVGANQIKNSDFAARLTNWKVLNVSGNFDALGIRTDTYAPVPGSLQVRQQDTNSASYLDVSPADENGATDVFTVVPGSWYELSTYYFGHRYENVSAHIQWLTSANVHISYSLIDTATTPNGGDPAKNLASYGRLWGKAQAPATAAYCIVFFRHNGTNPGSSPDSYVWWHKAFFAECVANQSEPTPWSAAAVTVIADGHTNQTAPNVPTGLTVAQHNKDLNGDGIVDIALKITCNVMATGVPVRDYNFVVRDATTSEEWPIEGKPTPNQALIIGRFPGITGHTYTCYARSMSFNSIPSAWSSGVTFGPLTGLTTAIATPSAPTAKLTPDGIKIKWTRPTDKNWKETIILRGGTEIGRTKGTEWTDTGEVLALVRGTAYTYTIQHVTRSDVLSTASSVSNSVTFRKIASFTLRQNADSENKIPAGDFDELDSGEDTQDVWILSGGIYGGVGAASPGAGVWIWTGDSLTGGQSLVLDNGVIGNGSALSFNILTQELIPVKQGKKYYWEIVRRTTDGSSVVGLYYRFLWYKRDKTASATTLTDVVNNGSIPGAWTTSSDHVTVPADACYCRVQIYHHINSTTRYLVIDRLVFRKADAADLVIDGGIDDGKTDQTAPNTPSAPTVGAGIVEVLEDGTIQAHSDVSWTAVVTGVPVKGYLVKVTQVSNSKVRIFPADTNSLSVEVKTNKSYNYQIAAVNAFGKVGTYSSATAYTRANKSGSVPAGGTLTLTALKKRIVVDWVDVDEDTYPDHAVTFVYRNTVNTTPTPGTTSPYKKHRGGRFVDEGVTTGQTYFYWVAHRDTSGNFGTLSSVASAASGGNEVTGFTDLTGSITGGQIPNGTITIGMTTSSISTPGAPTVAQTAKDANADGVIDMALRLTGVVPAGAAGIIFQIDEYLSDNTTFVHTHYLTPSKTVSKLTGVIAGHYYRVSVYGFVFNAYSAQSSITTLQATGKTTAPADPTNIVVSVTTLGYHISWGLPTELDYFYSEFACKQVAGTPSTTEIQGTTNNQYHSFFYPSGTDVARFIYVRHVNKSFVKSNWVSYKVAGVATAVFAGQIHDWDIADDQINLHHMNNDSVGTNELVDNAVTASFAAADTSTQSLSAGVKTLIEDITVTGTTGTMLIDGLFVFKNATSGFRTFDISIEDELGNALHTYPNTYFDIDEMNTFPFMLANPGASSKTIRLYVTSAAAASVTRTKAMAYLRKR